MAEANAVEAAVSSQNSTDGAESQQSREQKFFHLFDTCAVVKVTLVISTTQYSAVVDAILRNQRGEKVSNTKEHNWTKRLTMQLENGQNVLYRKDGKVVVRDICSSSFRLPITEPPMEEETEIISLYLSLCRECELKKAKVRKSVVVKPLFSKDFNSRCQVDLVDLQSRPDDSYSFLMVYQDHLTKFVVLRALERKTAIAVAEKLKEIFAVFGAPRILQSDNGKEFANHVVKELVRQWPECRIVLGKPRHSQSQGSVERANRDVGDMLTMYLKDNKTTHWAAAMPVIQAAKNPMFGKRMVLESEGMEIPSNEMRGLPSNEEDLEPEPFVELNGEDWVTDVDDHYIPSEDKENSSEDRSVWASDEEADLSVAHKVNY